MNCWEYMLCGQEIKGQDGETIKCPVPSDTRFDGIHGGKCAGRACWVVLNTTCNGTVQDTLTKKYRMCGQCDFYTIVRKQEGDKLFPTLFLLK